jgi:hypothetical protein
LGGLKPAFGIQRQAQSGALQRIKRHGLRKSCGIKPPTQRRRTAHHPGLMQRKSGNSPGLKPHGFNQLQPRLTSP